MSPRMRLAIVKQVGQCVLDALEISDPAPSFLQPRTGDTADAAPVGAILQFQQGGHLLQAEAERLRALDEANAIHVSQPIPPVSPRRSARSGHQPAPLVVPYGLDADSRRVRNVADREIRLIHINPLHLTPY